MLLLEYETIADNGRQDLLLYEVYKLHILQAEQLTCSKTSAVMVRDVEEMYSGKM